MLYRVCLILVFIGVQHLSAQSIKSKASPFIEVEAFYSLLVPNYPSAPKPGNAYASTFSFGYQTKKDSSWQAYYGYPQTGIQFSYLHVQNQKDYGSQFAFNPFICFNRPFGTKHSLDFKLGLGMAYHTAPYDSIDNPTNLAIGSPYSWYFNANMAYRFVLNKRLHLKFGAGFWHASNGHTRLPNFGQNYGVFGLGLQYYPGEENPYTKYERTKVDRSKKYYYLRAGLGFGLHEYGGTTEPIGGPKYLISSASLAFGVVFRKYLLVKTGLAYQYYSSYAHSQIRKEFPSFDGLKQKAASNLILFLGTELMFGHLSFDLQGGLNLWKPYFSSFYDKYEDRSKFDKTMKLLFSTRLGLNLYAINTAKNPKHNFSIGVFMNANYGQADFSSIFTQYSFRLK
ncbi:MAG: acyloxyacyl hydrolase [Chitinophagales bacterium]